MRRLLLVLLTFALFTACGGNAATPPPATQPFVSATATLERAPVRGSLVQGTSAPAPALTGKFIYAPGDGSVWVQDPANGSPNPVLKPSPEVFYDAPQWAPDGKTFAYVHSSLTEQGTAQNSIYQANADGGQEAPVAVPTNNKTAFNWPHYSWDGKWIYYTSSYPVPPNKQHTEIDRIPIGGGEPVKVIDDARMSSESPDGKQIAYIKFNFETFMGGLWVADINGQNARPLLNDDVFIAIAYPQYSPDGSQILFAASGPNTRPLPGVSFAAPSCEPQLLCMFAQPAYADGLPWDLWTVTADGSKFTRLTEVGADSPSPAWSRDGKYVAFFDTSGQYLVDVQTRSVSQLNQNGGHGVFAWWQGK